MLVLDTIRAHSLLSAGETVAVAVSGGSDSMAVLDVLLKNRETLKIRVAAANFEHGIRGEASRADTEFVRSYCEARGVPFLSGAENVPEAAKEQGIGIEEAARNARYAFFRRLLAEGACQKIAVCHNADDNAETVLMHLARGAGLAGAAGMRYADGGIVRPLLDTSKAEVRAYVLAEGVPFREDETNADETLTRNFTRLRVIPLVEQRYPGFREALLRFAASAREDEEYLKDAAERELIGTPFGYAFPLSLTAPVFKRAVMEAHRRLGGRDVTGKQLAAAVRLSESGRNGGEIQLPGGISVYRDYGQIAVEPRPRESEIPAVPYGLGRYWVGAYRIEVRRTGAYEPGGQTLSCVPAGAVWRKRLPDDRFRPFGRGGEKTLNRFLSDRKIPERRRDGIPVLAQGSDVLAVLGVEVAEAVHARKETNDKILILNTDEVWRKV